MKDGGFWHWAQMIVLGTAYFWWDSGGKIAALVILGFHFIRALLIWLRYNPKTEDKIEELEGKTEELEKEIEELKRKQNISAD